MKPRQRIRKPLLGFGPAGYILLLILIALLIPTLMNTEAMRNGMHAIIAFFFGPDILYPFVMQGWYHTLALFNPAISLITGLFAPIAFFISPHRIRWYWYAIWGTACLVIPVLSVELYRPLNILIHGSSGWSQMPMCIVETASVLVMAMLVRMITRSRLAAGIWLLAILITLDFRLSGVFDYISPITFWLAMIENRYFIDTADILFHTVSLGSLFLWAILERKKAKRPATLCPSCDYDLAGLPKDTPCPECGELPPEKPSPSGAVAHAEGVNHDPSSPYH